MGFWGDLVKVVRSSVFKNELKNGGFQVNSAEKLVNSRTIRTNLASTSTASFNGTGNITPGVTGVLKIANGGTGASNAADARAQLGIKTKKLQFTMATYDVMRALTLGAGIKASYCVATISGVSASSDTIETDYSMIAGEKYSANPFTTSVVHDVNGETRIYITRPSAGDKCTVQVDVIYI